MNFLVGIVGYATNYAIKEKYCQLDIMQPGDGLNESGMLHIMVLDSMLQNKLKLIMNRKMVLCRCICNIEVIKTAFNFYLKDIEIEEGDSL